MDSPESALAAIHDSQDRIKAIALVHGDLYESKDCFHIEMEEYSNELISNGYKHAFSRCR
ncbi:MAG: hypothetical protein E4H20_06785 [Spirochaetales bacterium]|nr:MAG: hypothetical protein E4H20_06785 [Spirochaetales bacterium]